MSRPLIADPVHYLTIDTVLCDAQDLGNAEVVTSEVLDCARFRTLRVWAYSDQTGTISVKQSTDGTNFRESDSISVVANTLKQQEVAIYLRYVQVTYTNSATPSTDTVCNLRRY